MAFAQNPVTLNNTGNILYLGNNITKLGSNLTIGTSPVTNEQFYFLGNANITGNIYGTSNLTVIRNANIIGNILGSSNLIILNGNIGVGTSNPRSLLDIAGEANISGNLVVSGNINISRNLTFQPNYWTKFVNSTTGFNGEFSTVYNVTNMNTIELFPLQYTLTYGSGYNVNIELDYVINSSRYQGTNSYNRMASIMGTIYITISLFSSYSISSGQSMVINSYDERKYINNSNASGGVPTFNTLLRYTASPNHLGTSQVICLQLTGPGTELKDLGVIINGRVNVSGATAVPTFVNNIVINSGYSTTWDTNIPISYDTTLTNTVNYNNWYVPKTIVDFEGNVGISTLNPRYKIDVAGDANISGNLNFSGNLLQNGSPYIGSQWITGNGSGNIYYMGNVGINMVSPIYPLDVVGDANISSNLYVSNVYIRENCVIQSGDFSILNGNLSVYKNLNTFGESFLSGNLTIYNSDIYNYGNIYTYNGLYINKNGALYTQNETSGQHAIYTYDTVNSMTTLFGGADDTNRVGYMGVGGYGTSLPLILNPLGGNVGINNGNPRQRLDVAGSANISGSIFAANQTVNITGSTVTIKSVSGLMAVGQLLNFDTHGSGRGGGILFTQPNANVKQFLGRGYIGGSAITSISYNTTTTGESVYHSGTASSGNVTKMSLTDTGDMALAGTLRIGANANVIGNLGITGNLIGTSNIILLNGNMGLRTTTTNATLDVNGNVLINGNLNVDNGLFWTDPINNRVGILKTDPQYDLDVKGTANMSGNIFVNGLNLGMGIPGYYYPNVRTMSLWHNTNNGLIGFNYPNPECMLLMTNLGAGLLSWGMYMGVVKDLASTNPTNSLRLDLGSSRDLATNVNNAGANTIVPRVSIRYHGNAGIMGINRTNPMYALDVNGTANISGSIIMNANANVIGNLGITGNLIGTSNIILLNGNMGVGTSDPQYRLDVSGSTRITTTLDVNSKALEVFSGIIHMNTNSINLLGNPNVTDGFIRLVKSGNVIFMQPALQPVGGSTAPLVISRFADSKRIMTITEDAVAIGNMTGTSPQANLYVLGNAMITGNLNVDNGTLWVDATNNRVGILNTNPQHALDVVGSGNISTVLNVGTSANIGNRSNYALFLNTDVGTSEIGCSIKNAGLGNTIIQPEHQGVSWRNTLLNPNGGSVGIGTTVPAYKLDITGDARISGNLFSGTGYIPLCRASITFRYLSSILSTFYSNNCSVTRNSIGSYTITFANPPSNINYTVACYTAGSVASNATQAFGGAAFVPSVAFKSTTQCLIWICDNNSDTAQEPTGNCEVNFFW